MDEELRQFKRSHQDPNSKPTLKDLYGHITPHYATQWRVIGTLLDLPSATLDIIEHDNHHKAMECCNAMLNRWLQVDTTASWGKLLTVIESPAMSPDKAPLLASKLDQLTITDGQVEAITKLSNRVSQLNRVQACFTVSDDAWPPEQLKCFTPLLLVHYRGHHNAKQVKATAKLMHAGEITSIASASDTHRSKPDDCHETLQDVYDGGEMTKKLEEILAPLENKDVPCLILIEGAPGIGKSVLLREIAYQWSQKQLLQSFKVVLPFYLRDPNLQQAKSIPDLIQNFCKGDPDARKITTACSEYLFENGGKDIVFLFDGFDELPEKLRTNGLICNILKRRVLPYCGLVLSSRPHATKGFHAQATLRVDILGFTEEERHHHIEQALQDQPHKVKELTEYLKDHPTIDSLCYVPFNLVVLIYIYKQGICLPKNSTELYDYFVCHTICRHLTKHGIQCTITKLTDPPKPYNKIVQQLSKLSLEALNVNKLTFTLDEIKAACPGIAAIPGAINAFGLLQVVEHFGLHGTTMTFNFMHFSIQEYLAAYHVANLPADEELKIIEEKFWSDIHFNMFSMYVALTKGQRPSFKHFVCDGDETIAISDRFLCNLGHLRCFRLYRCFYEADDVDICKAIGNSKTFSSKKIEFDITRLTATDLECLTIFLISSIHKQWSRINFFNCHLQDHDLQILHQGLLQCKGVTINEVRLRQNGLTKKSAALISDITIHCKVKKMEVSYNKTIGENEQLYLMLTNPYTVLEILFMFGIKLSSTGAIHLFTALLNNKTLKSLNLNINKIGDTACDAITAALEQNNCLVTLNLHDNPLSGEAILKIVNALQVNNTLKSLSLPKCPANIEKRVIVLVEDINRKRESQECQRLGICFNI